MTGTVAITGDNNMEQHGKRVQNSKINAIDPIHFCSKSQRNDNTNASAPSAGIVITTDASTPVAFESAVQTGGTSGTADSTGLTLTLSVDPTTLAASDITVMGATKGALSGTGLTRIRAISDIIVGDGETVSVAIPNPSRFTISGTPQTAEVYRELTIGMAYQGGIIAYILQDGDPGYMSGETHGLIASSADFSTGIRWHNGSNIQIYIFATALGTGQANTTSIVTAQGAGSYAAQLCADHTNANTGTGVYSDWYLPSQDELNKLYTNRTSVHYFASSRFDTTQYWSSSESGKEHARYESFLHSTQGNAQKYLGYRVRGVRSF